MSQKALGMIETIGILAAYEAADVALKSANVKMVGYEISRGGLIVIKFMGDVSAVRSAVDAGKAAASRLSKVWSSHVIARPAEEIEKMINSEDTINNKNETNKELEKEETAENDETENNFEDNEIDEENNVQAEENEEVEMVESPEEIDTDEELETEFDQDNKSTVESENSESEEDENEEKTDLESEEVEIEVEIEEEVEEEDICNLCGDPACPRSKGDLHKDCIHYDEIKGDKE